MKCQFTLKAVRNSLLACLLLGGVASREASAAEAIETTFYKAETMLKRYPAYLTQFKAFKDSLYAQLRSFLDLSNNESYATHIGHIEQNTKMFHVDFVSNNHFKCIKSLTSALYVDMENLLTLLKSHIGKRSPTMLSLSLLKFEHLLPKAIIKEVGGAFKLPSLLEHRLGS